MDAQTLRQDPLGTILDMKGDSAEIVTDEVNGYDRVIPQPQLLEEMAKLYAEAIEKTDEDYKLIFAEYVRNTQAYEATIDENNPTITVPLCKRIANQQMAWTSVSILSKNPIITVKPIDGGSYELPVELLSQPGMPTQFQTQMLTAEDAAKLYETYLQYKLTEKIDFEQLVEDTVYAIHVGEAPTWWKVPYDPKVRIAKRRAYEVSSGNVATFTGIENVEMADGEAVRFDHVSMLNMTRPLDDPGDEQTCAWLAEKMQLTNADLWEGFKSQKYDLCLPEGEKVPIEKVKELLGFAENMEQQPIAQQIAEIDMRVAQDPTFRHDVRTLWFFWPIKRTIKTTPTPQLTPEGFENADPDSLPLDGAQPAKPVSETKIEIRSLCATVHVKSRTFLNLYVNPYWHSKRPYIPFFLRKRPHRFSGTTSVGDIAPIQRLISSIFHLEIQNGVQQNIKLFTIRDNSVTWRWMLKHKDSLKPGSMVPFDDSEDIQAIQMGAQVQSMAPEIAFLNGEGDRLAVERDYTEIPGRTPASTIAQFEQLAKMQPTAILRGVRRRISRAIEMYLQTIAQFHEYEVIPFLDPKTNSMVKRLIGFPRETIENHFSFLVTATGDEDTAQAKTEKTTILLEQTDKANEATLNLMNTALDPRQPAPSRLLTKRLLVRREILYGDLVKVQRADWTKFIITEEFMDEQMAQADQIYQQTLAAEAASAQGAANANQLPPSPGGASIPEVQPGSPPSPGLMGQPGGEGMGEPNAPEDLLGGGPAAPVQ